MQVSITPDRIPSWKDGIVIYRQDFFSFGTAHGKLGESGSEIFSVDGYFLGMAIGKKNFVFNDLPNMPVAETADHQPDSKIVGSEVILFLSGSTPPTNDEYGPHEQTRSPGK